MKRSFLTFHFSPTLTSLNLIVSPFLMIEGVRMKGLEPPRLTTLDPKSSAATNYATSAKFEVAKIGVFLLPPNFITTFFLCSLFFFLLNVKFLYQKRSNVFTLFSIPKYSCTFKNVGIFVFFCHFSNGSLNFIGNCQH